MSIVEVISSLENLAHLNPTTEEVIVLAEKELELEFSDEYKDYLRKYGAIRGGGVTLTGIADSERLNVVSVTKRERLLNSDFPKDMYVIEDTGIEGILILQDKNGRIYEFAQNNKIKQISNSLSEYLLSVKEND